MLPNHAPLVIAEQFGTLAALYPGRIDLGLGRAPGTDPRTASALRARSAARWIISRRTFRICWPISAMRSCLCRPCPAVAVMCRCGFSAPVITARSSPPRWDCLMPSPPISRGGAGLRGASVSPRFQAITVSRQAACDAGPERLRRRYGCASLAAVHVAAAGLRQLRSGHPAPLPPPLPGYADSQDPACAGHAGTDIALRHRRRTPKPSVPGWTSSSLRTSRTKSWSPPRSSTRRRGGDPMRSLRQSIRRAVEYSTGPHSAALLISGPPTPAYNKKGDRGGSR